MALPPGSGPSVSACTGARLAEGMLLAVTPEQAGQQIDRMDRCHQPHSPDGGLNPGRQRPAQDVSGRKNADVES